MKKLKQLWQALNGNKTTIGMILVLASQGLKAFAPHILTPEQFQFIDSVGLIVGGVGLGHKGLKSEAVQSAIDKLKTKKKVKL